jgi:hypothetical protein
MANLIVGGPQQPSTTSISIPMAWIPQDPILDAPFKLWVASGGLVV